MVGTEARVGCLLGGWMGGTLGGEQGECCSGIFRDAAVTEHKRPHCLELESISNIH